MNYYKMPINYKMLFDFTNKCTPPINDFLYMKF